MLEVVYVLTFVALGSAVVGGLVVGVIVGDVILEGGGRGWVVHDGDGCLFV